jgi:iron-sulfur cluster repair protein YtfE (RIC family)
MEIVKLLETEHQEVRDLFQQFFGGGTLTRLVNKMVGSRPRGRKAVVGKICDALDLHMRLEEEIFYPEVRATGDGELKRLVDEGEREHAGVKEKVAKARTLLGDEAALEETMTAIQGDVDHHVQEEDNEMFPRLRSVMSEQKRGEMGKRYAARKRAQKRGGGVRRTAAPRRARRVGARASQRATVKPRRTATAKRRTVTRRSAAGRRKARATAKRTRR